MTYQPLEHNGFGGKNRSISFVFDGSRAVELWRGLTDVDN